MAGITALRKIIIGKEASYGAGNGSAAAIWRGMGIAEDKRTIKSVDESIGVAIGTTRSYIPKEEAEVTFDQVEATFQQLPYILNAGLVGVAGVQDGAGTGYVYSYAASTTTALAPYTYVLHAGDQEHQLFCDGCFVKSFKLSGNAGEGVMMEAVWHAYATTVTTTHTTGTVQALTPTDNILFPGSRLYIDAVSGTIGTTLKEASLLSFELDVTTGFKAKYTNESKNPSFVYFDGGEWSATLKLVYEQNAVGRAEYTKYLAATPSQVRLIFEGTALGTTATYDYDTLIIDAAGTYTAMPYGDVDGNVTFEAELKIAYDPTAALGLEMVVVNELSALP